MKRHTKLPEFSIPNDRGARPYSHLPSTKHLGVREGTPREDCADHPQGPSLVGTSTGTSLICTHQARWVNFPQGASWPPQLGWWWWQTAVRLWQAFKVKMIRLKQNLDIFNFSFTCDFIYTFCNYFWYIKVKIVYLKNTLNSPPNKISFLL